MKKIIIGLITGVIILAAGMLTGHVFNYFVPNLQIEYKNPDLFRPWSDPVMLLYFVEPFLVGLILVWLWTKTSMIIKGNSLVEKGFYFGLIYWGITLPGMLMSYSSFPVSFILVTSWTVGGFIQAVCAGFFISRVVK